MKGRPFDCSTLEIQFMVEAIVLKIVEVATT